MIVLTFSEPLLAATATQVSRYSVYQTGNPTATLTVQMFNYAISPYEDWHRKAWATALVLLLLIGALNLLARFLTRKTFRAR